VTTAPRDHRTFCRICLAQCGLVVTTEGDAVVRVTGDALHPISRGYSCTKGRSLGAFHTDPGRLDHPLVRGADGVLARAPWEEALDDLAGRLAGCLAAGGPDAVGAYVGTAGGGDANGRRAAETLLRQIGTRSRYSSLTVDTPCKPLVAELMAGEPFLTPMLDDENATLVVLLGLNPVVSHGHLNAFPMPTRRIAAIAQRGEVWVVDPRRTETAELASRHLQPRPGTDYALLAHLVRELLRRGRDEAYLAGLVGRLPELAAAVEPYDRERCCRVTGLAPDDVADLLAAIRRHGRVAVQTGTGTTMAATANVTEWLVWALSLVTGSYDRPGGMWFQSRFLRPMDGGLPGVPPGSAPGPASRPELPSRLGEHPSAALADEIESGTVRALVVIGGNPLRALPDPGRLRAALAGLDVLLVADVAHSELVDLATHVWPCTGALERADVPLFMETIGCQVASQQTDAVLPPRAERRPMWWAFAQLAQRLGVRALPRGMDPDEVTEDQLLADAARFARVPYEQLKAAPSAVVWARAHFGWIDGTVLAGRRWDAAPAPLVAQLGAHAAAEGSAADRGLLLLPRRQRRHLNSYLADQPAGDAPVVLVHPLDAAAAGIADGDVVRVSSDSGAVEAQACLTDGVMRGAVSVPHGFAAPSVGALTSADVGIDPLTGMVVQSGVRVELTRP
jgi:anaerobic selenocysteine-containing dehydrogenase